MPAAGTPEAAVSEIAGRNQDDFTLADYSSARNESTLDLHRLTRQDPLDLIAGLSHEVFHAYESSQPTSIDWSDAVTNTVFFDLPRAWKENRGNYRSACINYEA